LGIDIIYIYMVPIVLL